MNRVLSTGEDLHNLIKRMYPICRSITGDGVRQTLDIIREYVPVETHEVPSGTRVFDWIVPNEWNIRDAWIKGPDGRKIISLQDSNLHVLNYSIPVNTKVSLEDLKKRLYSLPEQPDWIPYRTSYYSENWGFCMPHRLLESLGDGIYHVFIDSTLQAGHLTYGELSIPGISDSEILFTTHICHPSMCNDNLSGITVATALAQKLLTVKNRYSYRFLFIPGTIGSITWLAMNEKVISRIKSGLVLACVGDKGKITWKKTRHENSEIDRAVARILTDSEEPYDFMDFSPYGYDERQFSSPGINLSVGCFMRSPWGTFPEYHTSADNLDFVRPESLEDSLFKIKEILNLIENNDTYRNLNPMCEPQLGKRGLYTRTGGDTRSGPDQMAVLWVLNLSDGSHSLLDIAEHSAIPFKKIRQAADVLLKADLLEEI